MKNFFNKENASWQDTLADAGYRISAPRKKIMALLTSAQTPLTPLEIFQKLLDAGNFLGQVSVYRTLELLSSLRILTMVYKENGSSGYMVSSLGHHHHILCRMCQKAIEFTGWDNLDELIQRVEAETNFKVNDHLLQLYGLCPECQKMVSNRHEE